MFVRLITSYLIEYSEDWINELAISNNQSLSYLWRVKTKHRRHEHFEVLAVAKLRTFMDMAPF
ncbi:MAG: hypothetical protein DRJ06_06195 [Candidatus Aminicenantes bacterium]|nr:MAG: hypothetical protein DRJ06_06195 [Candidatus Aminicenantes bacterium]